MTPDKYTIEEIYLPVGDGHELYVQAWGNPEATKTIVHIHGGPGSGTSDRYKANFDPTRQKVIFYSQRGCGQSRPYGSLADNTSEALVADIVKILDYFKIDKAVLNGGSWGSCLALLFGLKHPERVDSMVLRGVFTASQAECDWLTEGGYKHFFPDVWDRFKASVPKAEQERAYKYHADKMLNGSLPEQKASAYAVSNMEAALLSLDDRFTEADFELFDPAGTIIETFYTSQRCFLPDRYILDNAHKLSMPIWLLQGRYDIVCPPVTAYELSKLLPQGTFVTTVAGHGNDRSNYDVCRTLLLQIAGE